MEKILITPLIGIGDVLMTTPAIEILKKNLPDASITYFAMNKGTLEVLKGNPNIDNLVYFPFLGKHKYFMLCKYLFEYSGRYSTCINFYPSNRIHYNIFSFLSFAKRRIGNTYLRLNASQLNCLKNYTIQEDDSLHCVEENMKLLRLLGIKEVDQIPPLKIYLSDEEVESGLLYRKNLVPDTCCIGVHAGTSIFKGHSARRWPKEYFAELIKKTPNAHFMLFGTSEEQEANQFIIKAAGTKNVTFVKDKSIREVAAIIKACNFFVSNDSGLMHLAASVDTPIIAIIGPTNPTYIKPWGVQNKVITAPVPCLHCFKYSPKPLQCSYNEKFKCLTDIRVDMVANEVQNFIKIYTLM